MNKFKTIGIWTICIILMAAFGIYQRMTGPTYPISGSVTINSQNIDFILLRTYNTGSPAPVSIFVPDKSVNGFVKFKRHPSQDPFQTVDMVRKVDSLTFSLPQLDAAGKIMYHVILKPETGKEVIINETPAILRYKGAVPTGILVLHVFFIFFSMVLSTRTGIEAMLNRNNSFKLLLWTLGFLILGGMVFGPIMQKYAFGAYWTGWPFGHDLTDNKTFISLAMWFIALWRMRKNPPAKGWIIAAAVVQIAIFLIPHSVLGSQIDYSQQPK
ncbi:MAG: hypothetical protein HW421_1233 [Ignavibacteria bacterium]|nr:hypothetical protein [Ignavibacteria bacterium]